MKDCIEVIKAIYTQEEGYLKLELIYKNSIEKEKILKVLDEISYKKEYQAKVSDSKDNNGYGFICIEFDDNDKKLDLFFDTLISKLGIEHC